MYPEYILKKLRQRRGLAENDCSEDESINRMSPREVFGEVCEWEGLLNYDSTIIRWVEDIFKVNLDCGSSPCGLDWDEVPHPGGFH